MSTFRSYEDYLGGGTATAAVPVRTTQPAEGFRSYEEYLGGSGAAPAPQFGGVLGAREAAFSGEMGGRFDRMRRLVQEDPTSIHSILAMADTAIVGFPTFGDPAYTYDGRDRLRDLARLGPVGLRGLGDEIRGVADRLGWSQEEFDSHLSGTGLGEIGERFRQMTSGQAVATMDFAAGVPLFRGASAATRGLQLINRVMASAAVGTEAYDPLGTIREGALTAYNRGVEMQTSEFNREAVAEMRGRDLGPYSRALDTFLNLGMFFLPIGGGLSYTTKAGKAITWGSANPFVVAESTRLLGKIGDEGLGPALTGEVKEQWEALNPVQPDLHLVERFARTAALGLLAVGAWHGSKEAKAVLKDVPGALKEFGAGIREGYSVDPNVPDSFMGGTGDHAKPIQSRNEMIVDMFFREAFDKAGIKSNPGEALRIEINPDPSRVAKAFDLAIREATPAQLAAMANWGKELNAETPTPLVPEPTVANLQTQAEQAAARLGAVDETMVQLYDMEGKERVRVTEARDVRNEAELASALRDKFGLPEAEAKATAALFEARAQAWSEVTDRPVSEWYETRLANVGREGDLATARQVRPVEGDGVVVRIGDKEVAGKIAPGFSGAWDGYGRVLVDVDGEVTPFRSEDVVRGLSPEMRMRLIEKDASSAMGTTKTVPDLVVRKTNRDGYTFDVENGTVRARDMNIGPLLDEDGVIRDAPVTLIFDPEVMAAGQPGDVPMAQVRMAVMPKEMAVEADALRQAGADVRVYDAGTPGARSEALRAAQRDAEALFQGESVDRAKVVFERTGRAILRALASPNASSAIHELGHIVRRDAFLDGTLTKEEMAHLNDWAGAENGKWTVDAEEKFARGFERYILDGKAPTKRLKKVFAKLAEMMKQVYASVVGSAIDVPISPEVRAIFDKLLGSDIEAQTKIRNEQREAVLRREQGRRDELLSIMLDDPRIDPLGDYPPNESEPGHVPFDHNLASEIRRVLGYGEGDTRDPGEIIEHARAAEEEAHYEREMAEGVEADILSFLDEWGTGKTSDGVARWYRGKDGKWRSDNRPTIRIEFADYREIAEMRPDIIDSLSDFVASSWREGDYVVADGPVVDGQPRSVKTLSEVFQGGEKIPHPILDAYRDWLKGDSFYQREKLTEEQVAAKAQFEQDVEAIAAERLAKGDKEATVLALLTRQYKVSEGSAKIRIRRAYELVARDAIMESYTENASKAAAATMLEQKFPQIPATRRKAAIESALKAMGDEAVERVQVLRSEEFEAAIPLMARRMAERWSEGSKVLREEVRAMTAAPSEKTRLWQAIQQEALGDTAWDGFREKGTLEGAIAAVQAKEADISQARARDIARQALESRDVSYLQASAERWQRFSGSLDPVVRLLHQEMIDEGIGAGEAVRRANERETLPKAQRILLRNRLDERVAAAEIVEIVQQTGSYRKVTEMLEANYPNIPKARYEAAMMNALADAGLSLATVPANKTDPVTGKVVRDATGKAVKDETKRRVVIGGGELMVPDYIARDVMDNAGKLPRWDARWDEERIIERIAGRNSALRKILVDARKVAVTKLTEEQIAMREALKQVYGKKHLNDKKFREAVMDWIEQTHQVDFERSGLEVVTGKAREAVMEGKSHDMLRDEFPDTWQDIEKVANWMKQEFDIMFDRVNAVRRLYGMEEIPYRQDYITHVKEQASLWDQLIGRDPHAQVSVGILPKRISVDNPFAKRREGELSRRDALANFEAYVSMSLRQIHLTELAVKNRMFAKVMIENDGRGHELKNLAHYFTQMANHYAGQKLIGDEGIAALFGKDGDKVQATMEWIITRAARNAITGNLRSAWVQTAGVTNATVQIGSIPMMESAYFRMLRLVSGAPDPSVASPFLKRRYGYKGDLSKTTTEKVADVASVPMNVIEEVTGRMIWNAAHIKAMRHWKDVDKAIEVADRATERILAGRSVGEMPRVFRTFWGRFLLPFQVEVNNTILLLKHDLPYDIIKDRPRTKAEIALVATEWILASWLMNEMYQRTFGDNVLPDPIDMVRDSIAVGQDDEDNKGLRIGGRIAGEVISALPGGTSATALASESGYVFGTGMRRDDILAGTPAGRYAGSLPAISLVQSATRGETLGEWVYNMGVTAGVPFGGRQIQKSWRGIQAVRAGEIRDYRDKKIADIDNDPIEQLRALLFGTNAHPAVQRYQRN